MRLPTKLPIEILVAIFCDKIYSRVDERVVWAEEMHPKLEDIERYMIYTEKMQDGRNIRAYIFLLRSGYTDYFVKPYLCDSLT